MWLVPPMVVDASVLVSSNVSTATDPSPWFGGTSYAINQDVLIAATNAVYRSVKANNQGNDPQTDDGSNWVKLGSTNRWKAFDKLISDPVVQSGSIEYVFAPTSPVSVLAVLNVGCDQLEVTVFKGADTFTFSRDLVNRDAIADWWSYYHAPFEREPEALFRDLPWFGAGTQIKVRATAAGGNVSIGQIVFGAAEEIGFTRWGAEIGILDASRKDRDPYGNAIIVERAFAQTARLPLLVLDKNARRIQRLIARYRATPVLWVGDDDPEYALILYGFMRSYSHVLQLPNKSEYMLELESLT